MFVAARCNGSMMSQHTIKVLDADPNRLNRKQPRRPSGYDEGVDEPAELLKKEPVDVEAEQPLTPNPNIDRGEREDSTPPVFEE